LSTELVNYSPSSFLYPPAPQFGSRTLAAIPATKPEALTGQDAFLKADQPVVYETDVVYVKQEYEKCRSPAVCI
jgi:hypothetical protein